jgi:hypothetical protein
MDEEIVQMSCIQCFHKGCCVNLGDSEWFSVTCLLRHRYTEWAALRLELHKFICMQEEGGEASLEVQCLAVHSRRSATESHCTLHCFNLLCTKYFVPLYHYFANFCKYDLLMCY